MVLSKRVQPLRFDDSLALSSFVLKYERFFSTAVDLFSVHCELGKLFDFYGPNVFVSSFIRNLHSLIFFYCLLFFCIR